MTERKPALRNPPEMDDLSFCPDCGHPPHRYTDRKSIDVRCGFIVGASGDPMPEPDYCECVSWAQVMYAHTAIVANERFAAYAQGFEDKNCG